MTDAFVKGFMKAAQAEGCTAGEAIDILKWAMSTGAFQTPSFSPPKPINPNPPIVDTMAPSKMFPMPGTNPGASGGLGAAGGLGSLGTGQQPAASNFGFNINQTGLGGVNNSVSSAPSSSVNSVLNKPTAAPAMAPTM
ncbi:hypothetical protein EKK58_00040 [Candidatus Dependentiae bacterium]|nr:MAG: hypothetical protein EKK58_00040 [Candidatus Dependentiae bacterium]